MNLNIPYFYKITFLPTSRHRNERYSIGVATTQVSVLELQETDFPVALRVTDHKSVCEGNIRNEDDRNNSVFRLFTEEYRTYDGKLFTALREEWGAAIAKEPSVFNEADLIKMISAENAHEYRDGSEYWWPGKKLLTEKSKILRDNKRQEVAELRKVAKRIILFKDQVWLEEAEPMYNIVTFGLGHNHGGTGFFISHYYNDNIPAKNYFNALQREEAMKYFIETANGRGDTNSVKDELFQENIEVLMPELIHRNPAADHGDGDPFLNKCEGIIQACGDPLSAGLLVMATALK